MATRLHISLRFATVDSSTSHILGVPFSLEFAPSTALLLERERWTKRQTTVISVDK